MGVSQWMLGMDAPVLWSIPACIVLWIFIVVAAKIGQMKGKQQMTQLWKFVDDAIDLGEKRVAKNGND
jgi:hypothetical protein